MHWRSHLFRLNQVKFINRKYSQNNLVWESVVGLEVHAQISSSSKLFSAAGTAFSSPVNANVSHFDCSIPGTLPVLNKRCVEAGVLTALALNCKVNPVSWFDRKHYFYADIPAGYQITQQRAPLANDGFMEFHVFTPGVHKNPYKAKVRIKQLQLEQDSGKSLHDENRSLVDLNRAGIPLMELVFEPDLKDGEEAASLVKELSIILQRIQTCSCKMEEGALRIDANVSINKIGEEMGVRTEIKNIGSVRGVAGAIRYEIDRQIKLKESGGKIINETRAWDSVHKITVPMRDKEEQQDYRYMPEPNLPPLYLAMDDVSFGCVNVTKLKETIPELPETTRKRLMEQYGITPEQAIILVNDFYLLKIFEEAIMVNIDGKLLTNLLINDFYTILNKENLDPFDVYNLVGFKSKHFGEIIELLQDNKINRNTAKLLVSEIITINPKSPKEIVEERNLLIINKEEDLLKLCHTVLDENEIMVKDYKSGKTKVLKAILGKVAAKSKGKADMAKCTIIIKRILDQ